MPFSAPSVVSAALLVAPHPFSAASRIFLGSNPSKVGACRDRASRAWCPIHPAGQQFESNDFTMHQQDYIYMVRNERVQSCYVE